MIPMNTKSVKNLGSIATSTSLAKAGGEKKDDSTVR